MKHLILMNVNLEIYLYKVLNCKYNTHLGVILGVYRRPKRKDIEYYL